MVQDSVREELEVIKSAPLKIPENLEESGASLMSNIKPNQIKISEPKPLLLAKPNTADLPLSLPVAVESKPEVQPTLVEFQSKNSTLPDWRLKIQNAVRQRIEGKNEEPTVSAPTLHRRQPAISGANALKLEVIEETQADFQKNDKVAAALKRIELSRQHFYVEEKTQTVEQEIHTSESKNFPFYIAARTDEPIAKAVPSRATVNQTPKPKLVAQTRNANGDLDTNKLPILPKPTPLVSSFDKPLTTPMPKELLAEKLEESAEEFAEIHKTNEAVIEEKAVEFEESEIEEIEDLAPFAMRFNAGIFDLLIGSFTSLILLSPFMISGVGNWFSFTGFLAFLAVTAVVMFIYLTTAIGTFGKTIGMRLFSLELVDIEENDYPTFHQAAVNSSVYLLSLALGGLGFLTIFFTEEKRAVHDIVSNTIVIKEG
ncbi:MAG TPA: RDD family protein [Pyrinomonadaceae bacterium]|nr:RDD family protein [Pyrinomonadaceae bacterium]